jgi:hypothetical protein
MKDSTEMVKVKMTNSYVEMIILSFYIILIVILFEGGVLIFLVSINLIFCNTLKQV